MATSTGTTDNDWKLIQQTVARLRASVMAVVFAACGGAGLFLATAWLLIQGGPNVGKHLNLLGNYFPGYTVTWTGSLVGMAYGAISGAILGYCLAWLYNAFADLRKK